MRAIFIYAIQANIVAEKFILWRLLTNERL